MERYLEGEEISHEEIVTALKDGTNHGGIFPVVCGVATRNLATNRLLDAIVEDLPSPGEARRPRAARGHARARPDDAELFAYVFKTQADPFAGRINFFRVYQGVMKPDAQVLTPARTARSASASCWCPRARRPATPTTSAPGDIGAVAKLKETRAGDWLAARDEPIAMPRDQAARSRSWRSRSRRRPRATRTRSSRRCAACRRRTRRSTCTATRRPATRSSPACRRSTSRSSSTA